MAVCNFLGAKIHNLVHDADWLVRTQIKEQPPNRAIERIIGVLREFHHAHEEVFVATLLDMIKDVQHQMKDPTGIVFTYADDPKYERKRRSEKLAYYLSTDFTMREVQREITRIQGWVGTDVVDETWSRNYWEIALVLEEKDVKCFYHFTDQSNIQSILSTKLFALDELEHHQITPNCPGGSPTSHAMDKQKGISKFVHLSFREKPPMYFRVTKENRLPNPRIIGIEKQVALFNGVKWCRGNALKKGFNTNSNINVLRKISKEMIHRERIYDDDKLWDESQAELLVPKGIAKEMFLNSANLER